MRRRVDPDTPAVGAKRRGAEGHDRSLAVGAADVERGILAFRMAEPLE
jgi:hypothetical protein